MEIIIEKENKKKCKEEKDRETEWKVEEAMEAFKRYKKIISEKGMKDKVKKAMEEKGKEIIKASKEI